MTDARPDVEDQFTQFIKSKMEVTPVLDLLIKLSKHVGEDEDGNSVMTTHDVDLQAAWAGLSESEQVQTFTLATIRSTFELEARARVL